MPYSIYDASIVPVKHSLESLKAILKKAEGAEKASEFPETRLHPDMLPLAFQVHMITNLSQQAVARLSGTEAATFENDMKTFADFYARIDKASSIANSADKGAIESRENATITIGMGPGKSVDVSATGYVNGWLAPNLFFHQTTAYNILRKEGVELGKMDFLKPYIGEYVDLSVLGA